VVSLTSGLFLVAIDGLCLIVAGYALFVLGPIVCLGITLP
jgi:hypothetical protein